MSEFWASGTGRDGKSAISLKICSEAGVFRNFPLFNQSGFQFELSPIPAPETGLLQSSVGRQCSCNSWGRLRSASFSYLGESEAKVSCPRTSALVSKIEVCSVRSDERMEMAGVVATGQLYNPEIVTPLTSLQSGEWCGTWSRPMIVDGLFAVVGINTRACLHCPSQCFK